MKSVISCSRRTDVPAFFSDWLLSVLEVGLVRVENPFNRDSRLVRLDKRSVHTIVLWSKNFAPLLSRIDSLSGYHLYFQFTVNTPCELEGNLPSLESRLEQMREIVKRFGGERVSWRFDPIVFWRDESGKLRDNTGGFEKIASLVAKIGVRRCVFSFVTLYKKVLARQRRLKIEFLELSVEKREEIAARLAETAAKYDIRLHACCQPELKGVQGVQPSACIDGYLLSDLAGEEAPLRKDPGQRKECNCTLSIDIGRYRTCRYRCAYCYAT